MQTPSEARIHPRVSVLICTYRRPEQLALLLGDLARQTHPPDEVVVVDNHDAASATSVVQGFASSAAFPVRYGVQPEKNISLTRNRCVALATGEWLGFLDDDERVPPDWLALMLEAARSGNADGVLAPVLSQPPADAPQWILNGDFYGRTRMPSGAVVPPNRVAINNALLRGSLVRAEPGPFDPAFGLTGGEDGDLLTRLLLRGARVLWCDEAVVTEAVTPARLKVKWILLRALRGGQDYATHWRRGRYGALRWYSWPLFVARATAQCAFGAGMALLSLPAGRHQSVHWLAKAAANAGKLGALAGWRYREYAAPQNP